MAFVNEEITEEDKKRIDFSAIKKPIFYKFPIGDPYKWTVDHKREVFFMRVLPCGETEPYSDYYVLWWKGDIIYMKLEQEFVGRSRCNWIVRMFNIPYHLENKREEIVQLLNEALGVFGSFYGRPFDEFSLVFDERKGILG